MKKTIFFLLFSCLLFAKNTKLERITHVITISKSVNNLVSNGINKLNMQDAINIQQKAIVKLIDENKKLKDEIDKIKEYILLNETNNKKWKVSVFYANVRKKASDKSDVISILKKEDLITGEKLNNGWIKIHSRVINNRLMPFRGYIWHMIVTPIAK